MEKQWIYNAFCYFLYSSGFRSVTAPAIKLINFRSQSRLEEHSIGHFFLMESEQEVSYTVFFKDRKANFVNQLNNKKPWRMNLQGFLHAEKGTWTLTGLLPLEPESSASAIPPLLRAHL